MSKIETVLDFDTIEGCFPDGAFGDSEGRTVVSAQWLHDFAYAIEQAILAKLSAKTEAQPVAWRPQHTFPNWPDYVSWTTGMPDKATVEYWAKQGVSIQYAYTAPLHQQESQLLVAADRYECLWRTRETSLLTSFFGNGCINKTRTDAEAIIDAAIAASRGSAS